MLQANKLAISCSGAILSRACCMPHSHLSEASNLWPRQLRKSAVKLMRSVPKTKLKTNRFDLDPHHNCFAFKNKMLPKLYNEIGTSAVRLKSIQKLYHHIHFHSIWIMYMINYHINLYLENGSAVHNIFILYYWSTKSGNKILECLALMCT